MKKEIVLSGMRATSSLHLGNYFGAAQNFVKLQQKYNSYFFIADMHALTTQHNPEELKKNVIQKSLYVSGKYISSVKQIISKKQKQN